MAKKRINMPFIVISLLVMALLAGGGYTLYKVRKNDPNRVLKIAEDLKSQGRLAEAASHIAGAANLKKDPSLFVVSGDIWYGLTYELGQDALQNAIGMYKTATQTDPSYVPAYEKLITVYQDQLDAIGSRGGNATGVQTFVQNMLKELDECARAILRVEPDNALAKRTVPLNVVARSFAGVEIAPELIAEAGKTLEELRQKDPKNAEIPFTLVRIKLGEVSRAAARMDAKQLKQAIDDALKPIVEYADADPQNPEPRTKSAQLALAAAGVAGKEQALALEYVRRSVAEFETARKLLKPTDAKYVEIMLLSTRAMQVNRGAVANDPEVDKAMNAQIEAIYREVLKNRPSELAARLLLAERLGNVGATRDEAIELLKNTPPPDVSTLAGQRGIGYKNSEINLKLALIKLLIERASLATDAGQKEAALKEAGTYLDPLIVKYGEGSELLTSRGRIELVRADYPAAYTTLTKAFDKIPEKEKDARVGAFVELSVLLARVAILNNQPGTAVALISKLINSKDAPHLSASAELHLILVQAYLKNNNPTDAKPHIEFIRKQIPDRPDVAELYLATLDPVKDAAEIKSTFDALPENTRVFALAKVGIAFKLKLNSEGQRILETMVQKQPKDIQAWITLSQYWETVGKDTAKANEVLDNALKANPGDANLVFSKKKLNKEDTSAMILAEIEKLPEGVQRQKALYSYHSQSNDEAKALEAALAWEKAAPTDLDVKEILFNYYLRQNKFDQAQAYAPALSAANRDKSGGKLYEWTLQMSQQKYEEAYKIATELTRDHPEFARNWVCLGQTITAQARAQTDAQVAKSKFEEAIPKFNEALNRQETNVDAYRGIIECCEALQMYPDLRRYLEKAYEKTKNPTFSEMLDQFEVRRGDPEKAIKKREDDLKSDAENPNRYGALAEAYAAVAAAKNEKGDEAGFTQFLQKAADVVATAQTKWPDNIRMLMYYSDLSVGLKKTDDAEKRWAVYTAGPGKKEPVTTALALNGFYRRAGKPAEAEAVLRETLKSQGDKPDYLVQLALSQLLAAQGKQEDALTVLSSANLDRPEIMRSRIDLMVQLSKIEEARKLIDVSLAATPSLEMLALRGGLKIAAGDDAGGMKDLTEVREKDPNNIAALIRMSVRNFSRGQTNDAIVDLLRVRELLGDPANNPAIKPQAIQVRLLLAQAYARNGNIEACTSEMENALKIEPDQKAVRLQLLSLYLTGQPPRFSEAERLLRESHQIASTALDPDLLSAEAGMWSARKDHPRAVAFIGEAIKRAAAVPIAPTTQPAAARVVIVLEGKEYPQPSMQYVAQKLKIMLDGRQYSQLIKFIDQQSSEFKNFWWVQRDRATAIYSNGDKPKGLAAYSAAIDTALATKNTGAANSILNALVEADNNSVDGAIKLLGDRINTDPVLKVMVIRLHANKYNLTEARRMCDEVLALGDKVDPEIQTEALQLSAQVWAQDPGRDEARSRDAYLKLNKLRPNDFAILNNLACLESLPPQEALDYAQRAKDLMEKTNRVEPLVLDTYGGALLRVGKVDEAIPQLLRARQAQKFRDVSLHLAEAYVQQKAWDSVDLYLKEAQELYDLDIKEKRVDDQGAFQQRIAALQKIERK